MSESEWHLLSLFNFDDVTSKIGKKPRTKGTGYSGTQSIARRPLSGPARGEDFGALPINKTLQFLTTEEPDHYHWIDLSTGIITLVFGLYFKQLRKG